MEPGGEFSCDLNPTLGSCITQEIVGAGICTLLGGEDCETVSSASTGWAKADDATFTVTETGPGPLLPSDQQMCQNRLSNQEALDLTGAVAAVGVLLYGIYKACTNSSWSSSANPADLVGDDTLVITPDGQEHHSSTKGGRRHKTHKKRRTYLMFLLVPLRKV